MNKELYIYHACRVKIIIVLLMIQAIGRALNVATPMIDTLLLRYETTVKQYCDTHLHQQLSKQFELHHFKQDLALVTNYLTFYK